MKNLFTIFSLSLILLACNAQNNKKMKENHQYTNHLINQSSPYLLQHAHNPVEWYPWGKEALEKAQKENKMLLISIGYAACHWCHVMEKNCFENKEIADLMNKNFVCIKVDREERPDIDQIYMNAVQLITGSGGWPLNCFALPDGTPFYGGTYFPPNNWTDVLQSLATTWKSNQNKILQAAKQLKNGVENSEVVTTKTPINEFKITALKNGVEKWKKDFDLKYGSNKKTPKFPMPTDFEFLLSYYFYTNDISVEKHIKNTLKNMAWGGIYDKIGGGFARYSTDAEWRVPHFEKMLYDNAQLISLYSNAYKIFPNPLYKQVVQETIEFLNRELSNGENVYFSSLDADSDGEEGKYYVWTYNELEKLVAKQLSILKEVYEIKSKGNWEAKIIFHRRNSNLAVAKKLNIPEKDIEKSLSTAHEVLFKERQKRIAPRLDDKSITAWNALMISGLCRAYEVFGEKKYLKMAENTAKYFLDNIIKEDSSLYRSFKNNKPSISAFLDDYASTIKAFIDLYKNTGQITYYNQAIKLTKYTISHFYDNKSSLFFYTSDKSFVPVARKMEITDGVIASSNSVMAQNLFTLSKITYNENWENISKQALSNTLENIHRYPSFFANWADLELKFIFPFYEVAVSGTNAEKMSKDLHSKFYPNKISIFSEKEVQVPLLNNRFVKGKTLIYVCENKVCKMPLEKITDAEILFKK